MITDKARSELQKALTKRKSSHTTIEEEFWAAVRRLKQKHELSDSEAGEGLGYSRMHVWDMLRKYDENGGK